MTVQVIEVSREDLGNILLGLQTAVILEGKQTQYDSGGVQLLATDADAQACGIIKSVSVKNIDDVTLMDALDASYVYVEDVGKAFPEATKVTLVQFDLKLERG